MQAIWSGIHDNKFNPKWFRCLGEPDKIPVY